MKFKSCYVAIASAAAELGPPGVAASSDTPLSRALHLHYSTELDKKRRELSTWNYLGDSLQQSWASGDGLAEIAGHSVDVDVDVDVASPSSRKRQINDAC